MAELFDDLDLFDWQLMLAGREHMPSQPGWSLKLDKKLDRVATYHTNEVTTNAKDMTATGILSTPRMDQSRDIVIGTGIDTEIHRRNPLILLMHQPNQPIGRAEDKFGQYTIRTGEDRTICTTHFFQGSEAAEQAFRLVEMKALPGMSVGIRPKPRMVRQKSDTSGQNFCVIEACHLIEGSHVFFPDNPECLIVAVQKGLGGKPLVPSLKEMLMSMLPETKPIVQGATLPPIADDWLDSLKQKSAAGESLTSTQQDVLKASPEVQQCIARKIPILHREHPDWEMNRVEAAAYSICGERRKDAGHEHYDDDNRPLGAQYMAAMHEMVLAMQEFMDDNERRLEPEVAKELEDLHEHHANMLNYISERYSKRYPEFPELMHKLNDEPDEHDEDDAAGKHKALVTHYRKQARAAVREWWGERKKKLKSTDHEVIAEVSRFLNELAAGPGALTRTSKTAALYHAKALKGIKEKIVEQSEPEGMQWEAVAEKLKERAAMLAQQNGG